jgi:hypothetical protein
MATVVQKSPTPLVRPLQPFPLRPYWPSGEVEAPLVLVEGGEKAGKTWEIVKATTDKRIIHTWWIEWGEKPCANQYGAIAGANFQIVPHDGTFWAVLSLLEQISERAREMVTHDAAPMIVVDTAAGEWKSLRDLAHHRTMASPSVRRKIERDPAARADNHPIPPNTWNDVHELHDEFMRLLKNFPGIAVLISRGREVAAFDASGTPTGDRVYKVEGPRDLAFDCTAWVRMSRTGTHHVIGARSVHAPLRPDIDEPRPFKGLPWLVFDILGYQPRPWTPPDPELREQQVHQRAAGDPRPVPQDWEEKFTKAEAVRDPQQRKEALGKLWQSVEWTKDHFPEVSIPPDLVKRIVAAGHKAARQIAAIQEETTNGAAHLEDYLGSGNGATEAPGGEIGEGVTSGASDTPPAAGIPAARREHAAAAAPATVGARGEQ